MAPVMRKSFRAMIAAPVVVAAALVAAAPASAQRMSLAERVSLLEQQAGNNQATMDLLRQVNMLKDEVVALRAQVEELTHQQQQARDAARVQYLDLDGRLNRLEGGAAPAGGGQGTGDVLELGDVPGAGGRSPNRWCTAIRAPWMRWKASARPTTKPSLRCGPDATTSPRACSIRSWAISRTAPGPPMPCTGSARATTSPRTTSSRWTA